MDHNSVQKPKIRIALYGGITLQDSTIPIVQGMTRALLEHEQVALVVGGFRHAEKEEKTVDEVVWKTATKLFPEPAALYERFQTWLPEPTKERQDVKVDRFQAGKCITVPGSAQARRFYLVKNIDAIVTFEGERQTYMVLELAIVLNTPALPIAFTGGDSGLFWKDDSNRAKIVHWFDMDDMERAITVGPKETELDQWAKKIAEKVIAGARLRCLVLMPFSIEYEQDTFFKKVVEPAIEEAKGRPIRLDRDRVTGEVLSNFRQELTRCHFVLADFTDRNPNVMYEIGQAYAYDLAPVLLVARQELDLDEVPFYLRQKNYLMLKGTLEEQRKQLCSHISRLRTA